MKKKRIIKVEVPVYTATRGNAGLHELTYYSLPPLIRKRNKPDPMMTLQISTIFYENWFHKCKHRHLIIVFS